MKCKLCGRPLGILPGGLARPWQTDDQHRPICSDTTRCKLARWGNERRQLTLIQGGAEHGD